MTDQRLAEAIGNWQARFLENGVNPSDYDRMRATVTEWSQWLGAWSALAAAHESLGRKALAQGYYRSAGGHLSQAAVYYHFAKFFWVDDVPEMRRTHAGCGPSPTAMTRPAPRLSNCPWPGGPATLWCRY